jgi:hypothetical protein
MDRISPRAKKALDGLTKRQKRAIRKENPFKVERNNAIRSLKARGLTVELLADMSGLCQTTICRILKAGAKSSNGDSVAINETLRSLKGVFDAFYKAIALVPN